MTNDIKQHKYYLIKFKKDSSYADLAKLTPKTIVYAKDSTDSESTKATFKKLFSAVNAGDDLLIISPDTDA